MTKLTEQQLAILASADAQPDGFAIRPENMRPSAAAKVAAKLLEQRLVRELRARGDAPIWREDEHGRLYGLKVLKAGRAQVADAAPATQESSAEGDGKSARASARSKQEASSSEAIVAVANKVGTKRALILGLMGRDRGATLTELIAATGWLPHTTRAALTGLRKSGFAVERARGEEGRASVYRIDPAAIALGS